MSTRKRESGAKQSQRTARGALQSHWQQHLQTAHASLRRLLSTPAASLMTVAVIGIALLLPSAVYVSMNNFQALSAGIDSTSQISLYLNEDVTNEEAYEVSEQLLQRDEIAASVYISPAQAAAEFNAYSGLGDVIDALGSNPLPGVIVLSPSSMDTISASALLEELRGLPAVESAQLDLQWVERLQAFLQLAQRASTGLMLILALAVLFVVGNTIRLAIEGRRAEIVVIKLVGGTNSYVARPFLYAGALYGLAGSVLAWALLSIILLSLRGPANELLGLYSSDYQLHGLGAANSLALLAIGTLLGWLGAFISVRQHLAAIEPR
jgi:cell division transport system permease protein